MNANENKNLLFKIDQLRKDKIIYATEAGATNLVCLIGYFFTNQYLSGILKEIISILLLVIAVGYTLYMGVGNFMRLKKIKELEKSIV